VVRYHPTRLNSSNGHLPNSTCHNPHRLLPVTDASLTVQNHLVMRCKVADVQISGTQTQPYAAADQTHRTAILSPCMPKKQVRLESGTVEEWYAGRTNRDPIHTLAHGESVTWGLRNVGTSEPRFNPSGVCVWILLGPSFVTDSSPLNCPQSTGAIPLLKPHLLGHRRKLMTRINCRRSL